ncbi:MAG TPA: Uma2 family endonuclease [Ktedonobacteraceae bacterium]|nr:Uma2 family endonuclease [Ktedonobacteraceae bacterium]
MMAIDPQKAYPQSGEHMSVEEYFQLDYTQPNLKYEYEDGAVQLMSGGSREHDIIAFNVHKALDLHFQSSPCFVSGSDMRVRVSKEHDYYFPNVTVSCDVADRRRGNTLIRSPRIVVEVLSPSTEKFDRTDKMKKYQAWPSMQEVVLVSQFAPFVEVLRRNKQNSSSWHRTAYGLGEVVVFESVDVHISMEEIYRKIDFDEPLMEDE